MSHNLTVQSETPKGVTFQCSVCGAVCEFVKAGNGEPNPQKDAAGNWIPPSNPEQWMGPCV